MTADTAPNAPRPWYHCPAHRFVPATTYMITAATLYKVHYFRQDERLRIIHDALFEVLDAFHWSLQAWAVFSNHYHIIACSPGDSTVHEPVESQSVARTETEAPSQESHKPQPTSLKPMMQRLHSQTSREVNRLDSIRGRRVWFQYWDTCLTFENSYYPRLNSMSTITLSSTASFPLRNSILTAPPHGSRPTRTRHSERKSSPFATTA